MQKWLRVMKYVLSQLCFGNKEQEVPSDFTVRFVSFHMLELNQGEAIVRTTEGGGLAAFREEKGVFESAVYYP